MLTGKQQLLLQYLQHHPFASVDEMSTCVGRSRNAAYSTLRQLMRMGYLRRKGQRWLELL